MTNRRSGAAGPDGRRPSRPSSFEPRTFAAWDRASLGDLQRTIERRRKALAG
jgi:hypothetical protein